MRSAAGGTASPTEPLGDGITAVDTLTAGMTRVTAGYLVAAPRPALVECGPALSVDAVIGALRELGLGPDDLAYLVVSHIHLDHAGGAGDVADAFPGATIVCSELGARHLSDPQRLNHSSRRVYGPLMDSVYGACTPIAPERVLGIGERATLDLGGGRRLELHHTPGHAKHHIGIFEPDAGALFVGDSVGVKVPGMRTIRPATPPADFDAVLAQRSLALYRSLAPSVVYLAHYGPVDPPDAALAEAADRLAAWVTAAEQAYAESSELDHLVDVLTDRFAEEVAPPDDDPDAAARIELLSGVRSNAMGLLRYLDLKAQGRVAPER